MDVDKLVELGNSPELIEKCEPHIVFPQVLQKWMIVRTLEAIRLSKKK